jgi:hypothetical protein
MMALKPGAGKLLARLPWRLALAAGAAWLIWPKHPRVIVDEIRVRSVKLRFSPENQEGAHDNVELDLNASLRVSLHNPNVATVNLHECGAEVQYRGVTLGVGIVRAVVHPRMSTVKVRNQQQLCLALLADSCCCLL